MRRSYTFPWWEGQYLNAGSGRHNSTICNRHFPEAIPMKIEFQVEGMSCQHCVAAVTSAIREHDEAAQVQVDLAAGRVAVESSAIGRRFESRHRRGRLHGQRRDRHGARAKAERASCSRLPSSELLACLAARRRRTGGSSRLASRRHGFQPAGAEYRHARYSRRAGSRAVRRARSAGCARDCRGRASAGCVRASTRQLARALNVDAVRTLAARGEPARRMDAVDFHRLRFRRHASALPAGFRAGAAQRIWAQQARRRAAR